MYLKPTSEQVSGSGGFCPTSPSPCACLSLPRRYAAAPHPLLSFDPHFSHDGMSSGDSSSGGLTSQESTMERQKPGRASPGRLCPAGPLLIHQVTPLLLLATHKRKLLEPHVRSGRSCKRTAGTGEPAPRPSRQGIRRWCSRGSQRADVRGGGGDLPGKQLKMD